MKSINTEEFRWVTHNGDPDYTSLLFRQEPTCLNMALRDRDLIVFDVTLNYVKSYTNLNSGKLVHVYRTTSSEDTMRLRSFLLSDDTYKEQRDD